MSLSFWQILLVVAIFLLLFGRGKIPAIMSDLAAGIKGFKKEMSEDQDLLAKEGSADKPAQKLTDS